VKALEGLKTKVISIFEKKPIRYGFMLMLLGGVGYAVVKVGKPVVHEVQESAAAKSFEEKGVLETYTKTFFSIAEKLHELEKLDRTNEELTEKLATLEKEIELERSQHAQVEGQKKVQELGIQLKKETGSELARVMKSIKYEPPMHLLPHQQFTLALGYFRKQEYEQAAVLLSHLTELKDDPSYQRAEVYLINGISWYELKHFKLAEEYIKQSVSKSDEDTAVYRKSLLWQALTAQALNRSSESQKILTSIVSRFPHSDEAAMVNGRAPASRSDVEPNRALEARHIANAAADEKSHHEAKVEAHLESHSESISEPHAKPAAEHQQEHHGE
jgi:hypothetical protein